MTEFIKTKQAHIEGRNGRFYITAAFGAAALIFAFAYIFLMNLTIYQGYMARRLADAAASERAKLQTLETAYIDRVAELDRETSFKLGFVAANAKFVRVGGSVALAGGNVR